LAATVEWAETAEAGRRFRERLAQKKNDERDARVLKLLDDGWVEGGRFARAAPAGRCGSAYGSAARRFVGFVGYRPPLPPPNCGPIGQPRKSPGIIPVPS
jgi:hypothetical protein